NPILAQARSKLNGGIWPRRLTGKGIDESGARALTPSSAGGCIKYSEGPRASINEPAAITSNPLTGGLRQARTPMTARALATIGRKICHSEDHKPLAPFRQCLRTKAPQNGCAGYGMKTSSTL